MQLMQSITSNGELEHLVPERVWHEIQSALASPAPRVFLQVLQDCGALAVLLPEVQALFGVPQPEYFHPEIDTGLHTLMCVEQAALLSSSPHVRFAALVHDIGKGITPRELWPSHTGHEEKGAVLLNTLAQRLPLPKDFLELATLVCRFHTRCHRALKHKAEDLLETLELTDAVRRPERFDLFLQSCEADAKGRTGLEHRAYPQAGRLRASLQTVTGIDIRTLLEGLPAGINPASAIRAARLAALEDSLERPG